MIPERMITGVTEKLNVEDMCKFCFLPDKQLLYGLKYSLSGKNKINRYLQRSIFL